jgi:hypothetical protein
MKDNNMLIMVVAHKEYDDDFLPNGYKTIKVGNIVSNELAVSKGWLVDNEGENISSENPWYCELTAQYWGWKNIHDVKYIGLTHYRRFFFDYVGGVKWQDDILQEERIKEILSTHKIIMNYLTVKLPGKAKLYRERSVEQQSKHWSIITRIIYADYPDMVPVYNELMYGPYTIWGNMLITTKDVYDDYCNWLFDVMKKYDIAIAELGEDRELRVDGYLTEQLLLVYANYMFKKNEIYHLEVRNTESDSWIDYSNTFKGKMIKNIRQNKKLLDLIRYIRVGLLRIKRSEILNKK